MGGEAVTALLIKIRAVIARSAATKQSKAFQAGWIAASASPPRKDAEGFFRNNFTLAISN